MYEEDQEARFKFIDAGNQDFDEGKMILEKMDQEHLSRLKVIIEQFGWPGFRIVGPEGTEKMWLLVQHCDWDIEFQKMCLQLLKEAVTEEDAPKRHLAYLMDRVLINEGKPQLYGTQVQITDGEILLSPVEDPDHLDERRKSMGLSPFAEYLSFLKEIYH
jgi:hypothetical protein